MAIHHSRVGELGDILPILLLLLPMMPGTVVVNGRCAYVSQTAWILNASVRSNITFAFESTFGKPVSEERYQRILDICRCVWG